MKENGFITIQAMEIGADLALTEYLQVMTVLGIEPGFTYESVFDFYFIIFIKFFHNKKWKKVNFYSQNEFRLTTSWALALKGALCLAKIQMMDVS